MVQVLLESLYELFVTVICFGTGRLILHPLGFRNLERHVVSVEIVGFLFWFFVSLAIWQLFHI